MSCVDAWTHERPPREDTLFSDRQRSTELSFPPGEELCHWHEFLLPVEGYEEIRDGLSHHRWYHETFPEYPPERRAVVPFLI
jgi:hypothetical protein